MATSSDMHAPLEDLHGHISHGICGEGAPRQAHADVARLQQDDWPRGDRAGQLRHKVQVRRLRTEKTVSAPNDMTAPALHASGEH
jgi:hypothetical protein